MFFALQQKERAYLLCFFHIDDVLITWDETWDINIFKTLFEWGEWLEAPNTLTYVSREIRFEPLADGNCDGMSVVVSQPKSVRAIGTAKVTAKRLTEESELTPSERTEFKSCVGSLQFLASNSRPDLAAGTSLIQGSNLTPQNLSAAYKLIDYAKETSHDGIRIRAFDLSKRLFVGYGDSSWANADNLRTQIGTLIVITTKDAFGGSAPASIMDC